MNIPDYYNQQRYIQWRSRQGKVMKSPYTGEWMLWASLMQFIYELKRLKLLTEWTK